MALWPVLRCAGEARGQGRQGEKITNSDENTTFPRPHRRYLRSPPSTGSHYSHRRPATDICVRAATVRESCRLRIECFKHAAQHTGYTRPPLVATTPRSSASLRGTSICLEQLDRVAWEPLVEQQPNHAASNGRIWSSRLRAANSKACAISSSSSCGYSDFNSFRFG
jgi:hypothetical protein